MPHWFPIRDNNISCINRAYSYPRLPPECFDFCINAGIFMKIIKKGLGGKYSVVVQIKLI